MKSMAAAKVKTLPEMAMFVLEQMKSLPTQQHLDDKLSLIHTRTDEVIKKTEDNSKAIQALDDRLRKVEKAPQRAPAGLATINNGVWSVNQNEEFERAARSVRFWPIDGETTEQMSRNLDEFLKGGLLMEEHDLARVIVDDIQRVRPTYRAKQHDEILVTFRDREIRLLVLSYARNLAKYTDTNKKPTAGMRMEIPTHLQSIYKMLDSYGYNVQLKHGKGTRRIIKFDFIERSLYLTFRLPDSDVWHQITPAMAKKYREKENEKILASFNGTLSPPNRQARPALTGSNTIPMGAAQANTRTREHTWTPSTRGQWQGSSNWN